MTHYINIIRGNYLQYIRSYFFLITIMVSFYVAFSLIPPTGANYTTIRYGEYTGTYDSVWIGFVTSTMCSVLLSLLGFFLINGAIQRDIQTRVGHIIGSTQLSNWSYLCTKVLSNFFILATLLILVFIVSLGLCILYAGIDSLVLSDYILAYLLIPLPALFLVSSLSILLEVLFPQHKWLQYFGFVLIYFLGLFSVLTDGSIYLDMLGTTYATDQIAAQISQSQNVDDLEFTIGLVAGARDMDMIVDLESIHFDLSFVMSRLVVIGISLFLVLISSFIFHRFNVKTKPSTKKKTVNVLSENTARFQLGSLLQDIKVSYSLMPMIKAELLMIFRKGSKSFWMLILIGMVAMLFVPSSITQSFILPILWFLQVNSLSDLVTKDISNRTHYFAASSLRPVQRLFLSRCIAAFLVVTIIGSPLILNGIISLDAILITEVFLGAAVLVSVAVFLGVWSKSNKLFEVIFFFVIYCNLNSVPITDYFGAIHQSWTYLSLLGLISVGLFVLSYIRAKTFYY